MVSKKSSGARRLWDKGEKTNDRMRVLTVGEDPVLDQTLVRFDVLGSAAHARMLARMGYLRRSELRSLLAELKRMEGEAKKGTFAIPFELEDMHTAIESRLAERTGATGERIHTARSRNDQVLLATRLFLRDRVVATLLQLSRLLSIIEGRFEELRGIMMPGYTHFQPAMPSSFGLWLHAWFEGLLECMRDGLVLYGALNTNPLGAGAGFGTSLKIDREHVARLLCFHRAQRSVIDINNSRGRYEERFLRWGVDIGVILEKFACDVILYTTREFGFISLPPELTTGSSIMPQKRNPDIVELLRGRISALRGYLSHLQMISAKLPSSYHRDFQLTKGPALRGGEELSAILEMGELVFRHFTVNRERVAAALYPDLFATYDANREVAKGVPFREAYRRTADRVKQGHIKKEGYEDDFLPAQRECERYFKVASDEHRKLKKKVESMRDALDSCYSRLWQD